jgi:predicted alpha/beta-fold hydrolase
LFRKPKPVNWQRQRLELPDGDFLDLDWIKKQGNNRLVVLGHGLEGGSNSTYILAAAHLFNSKGFDVLAWNHRSCSGEMNRLPKYYHHGVTDDLHAILNETSEYQEVNYVGYSLGGNVMLKYLGEGVFTIPKNFNRGVAISSPVDLISCVYEIHRKRNRVYHNRFLKSLIQKVIDKAKIMPDKLSPKNLAKVKTLSDFDQYYTAPLHGFESPEDYYAKASSRQFLTGIKHTTLLLQAQDDPMLGKDCFPIEEGKSSKYLHFLLTKYGGHVAFTQPGSKWHWMEEVALSFISGKDS